MYIYNRICSNQSNQIRVYPLRAIEDIVIPVLCFLTMLTIFNDYNDLYEISMIGACLDFKVNITGGGGVLL